MHAAWASIQLASHLPVVFMKRRSPHWGLKLVNLVAVGRRQISQIRCFFGHLRLLPRSLPEVSAAGPGEDGKGANCVGHVRFRQDVTFL